MLQEVAHSLLRHLGSLRGRIAKRFCVSDSNLPLLISRGEDNLPLLILREGWGEFKQTMNRIYQGGVS